MKHKLWHRAAFVLLGSVAFAACSDSTDPAPTASAIEAVSATTTSGAAGQPAPISPTVRVLGAGGAPAAGVMVQFRVTSGLGSVQFADVLTDASGVATAGVWTLGPHPGVQTVTATAAGAAPLVFSSNTSVGPANKLTQPGWTTQILEPFDVVPVNLSVRVADFFNQIHANTPVTFEVISGGGNIAGQTSVTVNTDATGVATVGPWTLGATPGIQQVRVTAGPTSILYTSIACPLLPLVSPVSGTITSTGCVIDNLFRNNHGFTTTAGQAILVEMESDDFNTLLNVTTSALVPRAVNDNDLAGPSGNTNSSLRYIPSTSGQVTIGAIAAAAGATGDYTLTVTNTTSAITGCAPATYAQVGVASVAQELLSTDCTVAGTTPFYGAPYDGSGPYPGDVVNVYLTAGQSVRIRMEPTGAAVGDMDALIVVFSPTNVRTFRDGAFLAPEEFVYAAATTGFHRIIFTSFGPVTGVPDPWMFGTYTFSITNP
ncbi:MAG TPA: hypothetical protein VMM17_11060 [Gemmatimonadaceae bacterium]|nr:hypothetical protein [Gemmatimonadaceae bacterium]